MKSPVEIKKSVQKFWDNTPCGVKNSTIEPGTREFFESVETHRYSEEFHIPLVAEFNDHPNEKVLEIGCGLGTDGRQFVRGGADYIACDLSIRSLELARQGFEVYGLSGSFIGVDAEDMPFLDNSFDVVYSHGVLHFTPNTTRAISEVYRVLRPGGKAIVMLYAYNISFAFAAQTIGRARLEIKRLHMGQESFNRLVGLHPNYGGWLPSHIVVNNSTNGLGNPLSKPHTADEINFLFSSFRSIHMERHYIPRRKIPILGKYIPQSLALWLGKKMGFWWHIKAIK
jgi:SAM-dependent methyltransferase